MVAFSWEYEFTGAARTWFVAVAFCLTGLFCGIVLPLILEPSAIPGGVAVDGTVIHVDVDDEGMQRPVFGFAAADGSIHEFSAIFASSHSAYREGDSVRVIHDPVQPEKAHVQDDRDLAVAIVILRGVGFVFAGLGCTILALKLRGHDDVSISRIGGLLGALSYAIPATMALPGLWLAHIKRPNWLFAADDVFGADQWLIGGIFSITGILGLVLALALNRYQKRTGLPGWQWHWQSSKGHSDK